MASGWCLVSGGRPRDFGRALRVKKSGTARLRVLSCLAEGFFVREIERAASGKCRLAALVFFPASILLNREESLGQVFEK